MTEAQEPSIPENFHVNFEAEFDHETMKQIEQKVQERTASDGVNRRIALAALTQSTSQMVDGLRDDPDAQEAMDQALGCLASTTDFLKAQLEIFEAAQMRIAGAMLVVTNDEAQP